MSTANVPTALRVLIVDDNCDAADTLATLLELRQHADKRFRSKAGYHIRVAYDGVEGLRVAREFLPDCVVSDIQMPGLNGYELARALRNEPAFAGTKLVALSAFADAAHERRATEAGFDYRLTKAGDVAKLLEVLEMIEEIKELASRTRELAAQNVDLADQTKELLQEVKEDVKELKEDVKELKEDVKELKEDRKDGTTDAPPG